MNSIAHFGSRRAVLAIVLLGWQVAACSDSARLAAITQALQATLAGKPPRALSPLVWKDVSAFYAARAHAPVWVDDDAPTKRAKSALATLGRTLEHGIEPSRYDDRGLIERHDALKNGKQEGTLKEEERASALAEFDLRLTTALFAAGRDVALGVTPPATKAPRAAADFPALFGQAVDANLDGWLDTVAPKHAEYAALRQALADLRAQADRGAVTAANIESEERDVPLDVRIRQVELNLDRWRLLPAELGSPHIFVNIPEYQLYVRDQGRIPLTMKVIVGKPDNRTPIFSDEMETVVFSPYWNIPDTIVAGETAPAIARDPGYLAKNQIEILRHGKNGAESVSPSDVDWDDAASLKELAFRQRPGAHNALGHVKFLFPNDFDVYLHDTPSDNLFARSGRALSHGCVRLEDPEALAKWVLRHDADWDEAKIRAAMYSGVEKHVKLERTLPVHLTYFTARVDEQGRLRFFRDIYSLDRVSDPAPAPRPQVPRPQAPPDRQKSER